MSRAEGLNLCLLLSFVLLETFLSHLMRSIECNTVNNTQERLTFSNLHHYLWCPFSHFIFKCSHLDETPLISDSMSYQLLLIEYNPTLRLILSHKLWSITALIFSKQHVKLLYGYVTYSTTSFTITGYNRDSDNFVIRAAAVLNIFISHPLLCPDWQWITTETDTISIIYKRLITTVGFTELVGSVLSNSE